MVHPFLLPSIQRLKFLFLQLVEGGNASLKRLLERPHGGGQLLPVILGHQTALLPIQPKILSEILLNPFKRVLHLRKQFLQSLLFLPILTRSPHNLQHDHDQQAHYNKSVYHTLIMLLVTLWYPFAATKIIIFPYASTLL